MFLLGGSVRGIVANYLGYQYYGIDLSKPQIEANIKQCGEIIPDNLPSYYNANSEDMDNILPSDIFYDMLFTCPPYHDLEVYSDDIDDLSNNGWETFK